MNSVLLLTKLQIMQSIGGMRAAIEKRAGGRGALAGSIIAAILVFGGIAWLGWRAYGIVGAFGLHKTVYGLLFFACGVITLTLSLPSVLSTFFGSSDINDLLPLPVSPFAVVLSKALGALAASYLWTFVLIAAPLAGWGIAAGAGIHYWIAYILAIVFAPFLPTAYSGTFSILIASVFKRLRRKDTITTVTTILVLVLTMGVFFVTRNLHFGDDTAQALSGLANAISGLLTIFPAYTFAVGALTYPDPFGCLAFVLISLAAFAVFVIVARLLYLRIVTSLTAGGAKAQAYESGTAQEQAPVLKALLRTELRKIVRNSPILINFVVYPIVIVPALIVFGSATGGMEGLRGAVDELGDVTTIAAGIGMSLFMLLFVTATLANRLSITCISRDGTNWSHMKYIPVPMFTQVLAKTLPAFFVNACVALLFAAMQVYVLVIIMEVNALVIVCGFALALGACWLMACVGTLSDSKSPKVEWGNDSEVNIRAFRHNHGMLRALLVGLLYTALPLLASPITGLEPRVFIPIIAIVGDVAAVTLGRMLLNRAARNVERFE